jgi:glucose repression mediator protein
MQNNLDMSIEAYEQALRHNQYSLPAMQKISEILRTKENFPRAVEYLQMMLKIDQQNGETWGSLGMKCPEVSVETLRLTFIQDTAI